MYNHKMMQQAIKMFLQSIGEDINRDGLKETPKRVADMYAELLTGYEKDIQEYVRKFVEPATVKNSNMVVVTNVPFYSFCEHHLMLFKGYYNVAYIPVDKIIGLSKLVRIMRVFAKRLQVQERMTNQIADAITKYVSPHVMVVIEAEHFCMSIRGVRLPQTTTITSACRGKFKEDKTLRDEFFQHIQRNRR